MRRLISQPTRNIYVSMIYFPPLRFIPSKKIVESPTSKTAVLGLGSSSTEMLVSLLSSINRWIAAEDATGWRLFPASSTVCVYILNGSTSNVLFFVSLFIRCLSHVFINREIITVSDIDSRCSFLAFLCLQLRRPF